jgi:hypothetical protein
MEKHMKQMLIEIDDRSARDLERVAPARERRRSEFVRLAIRRALDLALDRETREAYRKQPLGGGDDDLEGWDEHNRLAVHGRPPRRKRRAA